MFNLDLEKAEEPEIKLPTSIGSSKKQKSSRKTSTSALLTTSKPLTVWITTNWKILKVTGITDHLIFLLRNMYADQEATVRTRHGTTDCFQIGKGVHQAVYCHLAYLSYMQSISCEMPGWINHKLESRLPGEISTTSDMQDLILALGRYPLKGTGYPLQYSFQENSKDRGTWLQSMGSQRVRHN